MNKSSSSAQNPLPGDSLSHLDEKGQAHMVDVGDKPSTQREATAQARVCLNAQSFVALLAGNNKKGDVLATARIAGIQAAKQTSSLIPLCHPLPLTRVSVEFELDEKQHEVRVHALCKTQGVTGVEMEALTAASVAALTIYDMCKAVDKGIEIRDVMLLSKLGGKSGEWRRES